MIITYNFSYERVYSIPTNFDWMPMNLNIHILPILFFLFLIGADHYFVKEKYSCTHHKHTYKESPGPMGMGYMELLYYAIRVEVEKKLGK